MDLRRHEAAKDRRSLGSANVRFIDAMCLSLWTAAMYVVAAIASSRDTELYTRRPGMVSNAATPSSTIDRHLNRRDEGSLSLDRAWFDEVMFS